MHWSASWVCEEPESGGRCFCDEGQARRDDAGRGRCGRRADRGCAGGRDDHADAAQRGRDVRGDGRSQHELRSSQQTAFVTPTPPNSNPVGIGDSEQPVRVPARRYDVPCAFDGRRHAGRPARPVGSLPQRRRCAPARRLHRRRARRSTSPSCRSRSRPGGAQLPVSFDFRFLSEEYPALRRLRLQRRVHRRARRHSPGPRSGPIISAPNDFARYPEGAPVTIKATGAARCRRRRRPGRRTAAPRAAARPGAVLALGLQPTPCTCRSFDQEIAPTTARCSSTPCA